MVYWWLSHIKWVCVSKRVLWTVDKCKGNSLGQGGPVFSLSLNILSLRMLLVLSTLPDDWQWYELWQLGEICKVFIKACMICPVQWVPQLLQIVKVIPQVGNTFSKNFFATVRVSALGQGEGFTPSGKCTSNNKNILMTHTNWQVNEVHRQVLKGEDVWGLWEQQ